MNYSLLRSKTFWTIVGMVILGAGNAVVPVIPPDYQAIAVTVLGFAASLFHQKTGQSTTGAN